MPALLFCYFPEDDKPILLNWSHFQHRRAPPGQCPQYADDEGEGEDEDEEVHDNIPGNTDGLHGSEQGNEDEDEDKDKLPHTWKTSEFWNYVDSKLCDKICDLLPEKNLQDKKFTEYVSCHCLHNPTDLSV